MPLGASHITDIPEFYGSEATPDFIGTDALGIFSGFCRHLCPADSLRRYYYLVNFANTGNPAIPHNPNSLLSTVDWKLWDSTTDHPLLTFLDPAPNVSITFDNFRVSAMNLLNNISLQLSSSS